MRYRNKFKLCQHVPTTEPLESDLIWNLELPATVTRYKSKLTSESVYTVPGWTVRNNHHLLEIIYTDNRVPNTWWVTAHRIHIPDFLSTVVYFQKHLISNSPPYLIYFIIRATSFLHLDTNENKITMWKMLTTYKDKENKLSLCDKYQT